MNQDAVVNLVRALEYCKRPVILECFTPNGEASLAAAGIGGPRVRVRFGSKAEVMAAQRKSDIVVLPLAFQSTNPVEIRTVFPTKLLEYFVCGRPILVHAPVDSWSSRNARNNGWGAVADSAEPKALAQAIDTLLDDEEARKTLVSAAKNAARLRAASAVAAGLRRELEKFAEAPSANPSGIMQGQLP
jgi:glycosyltransferase involved in cell wall biosynthesis